MAARVDGRQLMRMLVLCRSVYQFATPGVAALARSAAIYWGQKFSDHAPLTIDYEWKP